MVAVMKIGFDNDKYLEIQSARIKDRKIGRAHV